MHIFQVGLTLISSCVEMVSLGIFIYSLGYLLRLPLSHGPKRFGAQRLSLPLFLLLSMAHIAGASMETHILKIYFLSGVRLT